MMLETSTVALAASSTPRRPPASAECGLALWPWLTRRSVGPRRLVAPGPNEAQLSALLSAAANAPDHLRLRPCRLQVLDTPTRVELGLAFQDHRRRCYTVVAAAATELELELELEMERALAAPCMIAVTARIRSDVEAVPPHEQWIAVGAVLGNLMAASHALGFAGKLLSGSRVRDPQVAAALCGAAELLVGFVYLGTSARP